MGWNLSLPMILLVLLPEFIINSIVILRKLAIVEIVDHWMKF